MSEPDEKLQARGGDMDAPERIWANVAVWSNGQALAGEWNHRDVGSPDDTPYIRADLAAPVRVKPLVWAKSKTTNWNDDWHTVPTGYTVRCADENGWKWATPLGSFGYASSPNGAKQAAQLDHEVRTRWALELAPDLAELVDALETARDYVHDASRGALRYRSKADISGMAGEDLVMIDAALAKIKEPQT